MKTKKNGRAQAQRRAPHGKVKLADFRPAAQNINLHNEYGLRLLDESMGREGYVAPMTAAADGEILDGSARLEVAVEKFDGVAPIIVRSKGDRPIIHIREDVPNAHTQKAKRIAMLANHIASVDYNPDAVLLAQLAGEDELVKRLAQEDKRLRELLKATNGTDEAPEAQIDKAAELQKKWKVRRGDVFEAGSHLIMCGDATCEADVKELMQGETMRLFVTDPPYGVSYADKNKYLNAVAKGNSVQTPIENDHLNAVEMQALWLAAFKTAYAVADKGCPYYVNSPQGGDLMMMMMMMKQAGWLLKPHIIWVKNNHVLGRGDYQLKHEPILYGWKDGTHWFYGNRSQFSVWEVDKPTNSDTHPTIKPVELATRAIMNSSLEGEIVGDWFLGSGTTLVACEQTGRVGRGMEISEAYTAVCLERLKDCGLSPKRVRDATA